MLLNRFAEIAEQEGLAVGFIEAPESGDFRFLLASRLRKILLNYDNKKKTAQVLKALRVLKTFSLQLPDGSRISLDVDALAGSADGGNLSDDVTDLLVAAGEPAAERDARAAIQVPAAEHGVEFTDDALDTIVGLAHGYPYFLQEWGYHVWNAAEASPVERDLIDRVTPGVVRRLVEKLLSRALRPTDAGREEVPPSDGRTRPGTTSVG